MSLTIVGLGLGDVDDISLKGYKAIKEADLVYLEIYTSLLIDSDKKKLEEFYGRDIIEADRICVEEQNDQFLTESKTKNVVILIGGDPFSATTHTELYYKALELGLNVNVVHNASIINAVAITGFGETVSIPFFQDKWRPTSFLDKIVSNYKSNLHTLCLLDIKVKERTDENILANRMIFEPPRFMSINVAIDQLLEIGAGTLDVASLKAFGVARLGSQNQVIKSGILRDLKNYDFGQHLHSLVICAPNLHELEQSFYELSCISH
ncbi:diphthine synthase [Theileria orientalis strain Shintoku]|uniref:diphthine methyl ester synthase n=1 Tax=Theileria orientalis strain Shintoku TaxID=869250 RepID=J4C2Q9_THEOR|nr:diphthine synthase [Theileria orientalis strain Shintoku]BAM39121.1 diphthine synthase [Theileria orientalis strain Shintoku]|eukprot:XP_009689422.1 diphthine synthase [Theileria orientalis strain Shintoku]